MDNRVYSSTTQNSGKRVNARLVMNAKDYYKLVFKLIFVFYKIFNKNFTALHRFYSKRIIHKFITYWNIFQTKMQQTEENRFLLTQFHMLGLGQQCKVGTQIKRRKSNKKMQIIKWQIKNYLNLLVVRIIIRMKIK